VTFSSQLDTCGRPSAPLTITGMNTLDTDTGVLMNGTSSVAVSSELVTLSGNQVEVRAIFAGAVMFTANAQLRAVGSRPLAIVAAGEVSLATGSLIDVGAGGAGAQTTCMPGPTRGENDNGGAAGGGGGGFGGAGGPGGDGDQDGGGSNGGAPGPVIALPAGVLGGCPGAAGGNGGDPGGDGGSGGGAIYIVSATEIELAPAAAITAAGGGGGGGRRVSGNGDAGGGGGGSGGMILLEAPRVRSTGVLASNGGGGGEGSGNGNAGNPGARGPASTLCAAGGANGSPTGTDGGAGGASTAPAGDEPGGAQNGGAGGGGGGVGYIKVVSPDQMLGTIVSPAASP
jgi:hypothetical protein